MGAWDKFMHFLGFGPEEDELEDEESVRQEAQEEPVRRALGAGPGGRVNAGRTAERLAPNGSTAGVSASSAAAAANVVPIGAVQAKQSAGPFRVLVVEPQKFDDVQAIADQLKNRRPIILNLEGLEKELAQKILVFLQGAIYALNGDTSKIANGIFFFAPPGVDVASFSQGLRSSAAGGAYDEAEVAQLLAGAGRLPLGVERAAARVSERPTRPAEEKQEVKVRPDWDWRR